jgi:hypothetical protein
MITGQQIPQIRAGNLLQDAVRDDARGSLVMSPAGKIGFTEEITGAENRAVLQSSIAQDLKRLATAADNPIDSFASVSFLEQSRAFSVGFDGRMIEQFLEGGLGQQSEQREAFYYVISHKSLHRTQRRTT